jgi:LysM repeat protein
VRSIERRDWRRTVVWLGVLGLFSASLAAMAAPLLQLGAKGDEVSEVQRYLHQLRYLKYAPTGYYGKATAEAVKSFQLEQGLRADGKVGTETAALLRQIYQTRDQVLEYTVTTGDTLDGIAERFNVAVAAIMVKNNLPGNEVREGQRLLIPAPESRPSPLTASRSRMGIQALPWTVVNELWNNFETARVIDVETGRSFMARRYYGYYHADIEPLTRADTQILYSIYGRRWSWERRPVIVQLRNLNIAASINGMPHGGEAIFDNGFKGQICCHFLGSKIHKNGGVDETHHAMIMRAANVSLATVLERSGDREAVAPAAALPGESKR